MHLPQATYRIQFCPSFGFQDAKAVIAYLADLGISDLYASPIFKAVKASSHGYDVVDPNRLNPELGNHADLEALAAELRQHRMGWLQDIVPNHMAIDSENQPLMDILTNGASSRYAHFFDVDWDHPAASLNGRILAPFLGRFYGDCLEDGEISLHYGPNGFKVVYFTLALPLRMESYGDLFPDLVPLRRELSEDNPDFIKFLGILYSLKMLAANQDPEERDIQIKMIHRILWELYTGNSILRDFIDRTVRAINGDKGKAESFNSLDELLGRQIFRLSFWKVAAEEINYRRFFCINGLISLRMENEQVLTHTHGLIFDLIARKMVTGLRIDHVDGLYDPTAYLRRLRAEAPTTCLLVEKILGPNEELPPSWPIQGTTGYDFLNHVNGLFCQQENQQAFTRIYTGCTGLRDSYDQVARANKKLIIQEDMASDVHNLALLLKKISSRDRHGSDITLNALHRALTEVLAVFPVYRTYISEVTVADRDRQIILAAMQRARVNFPALVHGFAFVRRFLLLDFPEYVHEEEKRDWLHFAMRFQQFSGPVMAKGVEDTNHYVYNRLISLNEVGGQPDRFGCSPAEFHHFNTERRALWPASLSATATHDTKRGEDVRARINVLSEMPTEWRQRVRTWIRGNRDKKTTCGFTAVPDGNDEYFLYQTLIGTFPLIPAEYPHFVARIRAYMVKAVREAKVHTNWLQPDTDYEEAYDAFVERILAPGADNPFLADFIPFCRRVAHYGMLNALSQVLLKITSPGVPDFYQGTELWDLSLVDPDNRRPVDFDQRRALLAEIRAGEADDLGRLIQTLLGTWKDGRIKLFLIYRALKAKRAAPALFASGEYLPLGAAGGRANHVIALGWREQHQWALTIAPRFFSRLVGEEELPLGRQVWEDTGVPLPPGAPTVWRNVFTDQEVAAVDRSLLVADALADFPVALLIGQG